MSALQEIIARLDREGPPPRTTEEVEWLRRLCRETEELLYQRRGPKRDIYARCGQCQRSYGPVLPCYGLHITFPFLTMDGYGCLYCRETRFDTPPKRWARWDPNALLGDRGRRGPVARGRLACHHRCRTRTGNVTRYYISRRDGILALRAAVEAGRDELVLGVDLAR
jgi:hypothetical protein